MPENNFFPLLLVVLLSFAVPIFVSRFKKLRLPVVVGEILAGILVGRSGFNLVPHDDHILELLAEFGFVFLMFLSGMEIDFSNLAPSGTKKNGTRKGLAQPLPLGVLSFLSTLVLATLFSFGFSMAGLVNNPGMMALILSTTSLGVVLPVLKERGLSHGQYGQSLLISALIADFATMLLITVLVAVLSVGLTPDVLLVGILFVVFFFLYRVMSLFSRRVPGMGRIIEELSHATSQIKVRAAFSAMLLFVVLSQAVGTEIILGSFLAGAMIALLRTNEEVELTHRLEAIGFGFFIPIFFIMVGVSFNLEALFASPQSLLLVPLLLLAALIVKIVPALLYRLAFSWRETFAAGALLSARLSLIIAASAIGLRLGVITESVNAAIILVALLTVSLAPLAFLRLLPGETKNEKQWVMVAGAGELGLEVARNLKAHREHVVVLDDNDERLTRARQLGLETVNGIDHLPPALEAKLNIYLEKTATLVSTFNDTEKNYAICQLARGRFGIDNVITQVSTPKDLSRFKVLGVTTMNPALDRANLLVLLARNPALYSLLTRADDNKEVLEVEVRDMPCIGKTLRQLNLPGDALILALRRSGELLVPHGNTALEYGDVLTLVGSSECIQAAHDLFNQTRV
ncbi:MAG: monovalent cation:proton antiporter family protein [Chloroflexota bacterium]